MGNASKLNAILRRWSHKFIGNGREMKKCLGNILWNHIITSINICNPIHGIWVIKTKALRWNLTSWIVIYSYHYQWLSSPFRLNRNSIWFFMQKYQYRTQFHRIMPKAFNSTNHTSIHPNGALDVSSWNFVSYCRNWFFLIKYWEIESSGNRYERK